MKSDLERELEQRKFDKDLKEAQNKSIALGFQFFLTVPLVVFFIWSFFNETMILVSKINLLIVLAMMIYNNEKYFKRKKASFLYIAVAVMFIIDIIMGFVL